MVIEKFDHQGRGIAHANNKIVFIPNALPGEKVKIEITEEKTKYMEARVTEIIEKSKDRVRPRCKHYEICGGCDLMHMPYKKQVEFKFNKVKEILSRYGGVNPEFIRNFYQTDKYGYRNKVTFQVNEKIGFYKKKSNEIVPLKKCWIADDKINEILERLKKVDLTHVEQITVRASKNTDDTMMVLKMNGMLCFDIKRLFSDVKSIIINQDGKNKTLYGNAYINENIEELEFLISPESFFQVNTDGAFYLYNKVLQYCDLNKNDKVLDLYCGTGTIGLYVGRHAKEVIGVEINERAVIDAQNNAYKNDFFNAKFICSDAKRVRPTDVDVVIVDPPRSGLARETIAYLENLKLSRLVYVSCNPITLARDIKLLSDTYRVKEVSVVDMFPNTSHIETVVKLVKRYNN